MDYEELINGLQDMVDRIPLDDCPDRMSIRESDRETLKMARQLLIVREKIIDDLNGIIEEKRKQIEALREALIENQHDIVRSEHESVKREFVATMIDKGQFALKVAHQASIDEYTIYTIADNVLREFQYQIAPQDDIPF